ncbi:MAG: phage holin family protein [Propionibacteriaceae bacterium]|jgi:hypothetical protein|nr:phage holin family protein [Propionibacteriaceae bacterium]
MADGVGDNIKGILTDGPAVISSIKDLAVAELSESKKHIGGGVAGFGGGAVIGYGALKYVLVTAAFALCWLFNGLIGLSIFASLTAGFGVVTLLGLVFTWFAFKFGWGQFKQVHGPTAALEQTRQVLLDVTTGAQRGAEDAEQGLTPVHLGVATPEDAPVETEPETGAHYVTDPLA